MNDSDLNEVNAAQSVTFAATVVVVTYFAGVATTWIKLARVSNKRLNDSGKIIKNPK